MEFSTPIIVVVTWVVAAFAVSRYFAAMGHSKGVSYGTGVVMGLAAAAFVYFINAPRERQQRQLADLDPAATEEQTEDKQADPAPLAPPQEPVSPQEPAAPAVQTPPEAKTAAAPTVNDEGTAPPSPGAAAPSESEKEFTQEMEKMAKEMSFGEEEEDTPPPPPQKKAEKAKESATTPVEPPKAPEQVAAVTKPETPPAPATPEPKPAAKPAPPRGPFELSLTATAKEVWVRVSVDGAPVQTRRLQEGQSFSWKAKRGFVVSVDNAGGLRASLNGKALPRLGPEGRSRANVKIP